MKEHVVLGVLWLLFCVLHSVLASLSVKQTVAKKLGTAFKYYRIFYTLFAFATLGIVCYQLFTITSPLLFVPSTFTTLPGWVIAASGLIVMAVCIKKYFLSLSGLKTLVQDAPSHTLMISGIHRFVRHPLYLGTFTFIWGVFLALPYLSFLITNVMITGYTLIGIELEEKKLELEFGTDYKTYRQKVPKLIPSLKARQ